MKNNALYILTFAISITLLSCKKDKSFDIVNSEFKAVSITKDRTLSFYDNKGSSITDSKTIQDFIKDINMFNLDTDIDSKPRGEIIKFISADSAYFYNSEKTVYLKCAFKRDGNTIFFYETIYNYIRKDANTEKLYNDIVKYQPKILKSSALPTAGGLMYVETRENTMVGSINDQELKLYLFAFKLKKVLGNSGWQNDTGLPFNQFNESFLQSLGDKDMLAIQPYTFNFKN